MYRVILVTDQPDQLQVFASFQDWRALGFEAPKLLEDIEEAMALIEGGQADAVAYRLPKDLGQRFFTFLTQHPGVLGMEAASDEARLRRALGKIRRQLHEAQQESDTMGDILPLLQTEFYHSLLEGARMTEAELRARGAKLKLQIALDAPVLVARLHLPKGQLYIEEVWHYGKERLDTALRNFFERDLPQMRYILSVMNTGEMRFMACPKEYADGDELYGRAMAHLENAQEEIKAYLGLDVTIAKIQMYPTLPDMCAGTGAKVLFEG